MWRSHAIIGLILFACCLVACQQGVQNSANRSEPWEQELAAVLARAHNKHSEIAACAESVGFDFADIIERCYRDQQGGLHDLFALSQTGLDGAGADSYAAWLEDILRAVGDNHFGDQLSREQQSVQDEVRGYLLFDFSCPTAITSSVLKSQYPVTFPTDTLVLVFEHVRYDSLEIDKALGDWFYGAGGVVPVDEEIVYTEVCLIPYPAENVYIVRYDWQQNWWGDWCVVALDNEGEFAWSATLDIEHSVSDQWGNMTPGGQSIHSVRALWLEGQSDPFVEVIGVTHMGHGSIYLYELDIQQRALRLVLTTFVLDMHQDQTLIDDGGLLQRTYRDINGDGFTDVEFSGSATCYQYYLKDNAWGELEQERGPDHHIELHKVFLWSAQKNCFTTNSEDWLWFDQVYEGRE